LTLDAKVQRLDEELAGVHQGLRDLGGKLQELAERVTRLEAFREADRAELGGLLAQFEARVEKHLAALLAATAPKPKSLGKPKK
jgi:uncharacterized protein involved in exopolysaccharide biosynthesis